MVTRFLPLPVDESPEQAARLSRILKTLRRRHGLTVVEMARRMNLGHRTYEAFEAGEGKLNLSKLQRFADITDADAYGILLGLAFEDDDLALRCAENKLITAALMVLQDLARDTGADLQRLDARLVMSELDAACARLLTAAKARRFPGGRE